MAQGREGSPYRVQEWQLAALAPGALPPWDPSKEVGGTRTELLPQGPGSCGVYPPTPISH